MDFIKLIKSDEKIICKLKIYENEGHVSYQSLYHGLRYLNELKDIDKKTCEIMQHDLDSRRQLEQE